MRKQKLHYSHFVKSNGFGVNKINVSALRDDLKLTDTEILLMVSLESRYSSTEKELPVLKNGVRTGEKILCDPICIALYYTYTGCEISLKIGLLNNSTALRMMQLIKSIFKKYNPEMFDYLL